MKTKAIITTLLALFMVSTLFSVAPVHANVVPSVVWLPPLSNQDLFQLKDGSTLPIKFTLLGPEGSFVRDETVEVHVNKVLLREDFDTTGSGSDPSGWSEYSGPLSTAVWVVEKDPYAPSKGDESYGDVYSMDDTYWNLAIYDLFTGTDYTYEAEVSQLETENPQYDIYADSGIIFRVQDENNHYLFQISYDFGEVNLYARVGGSYKKRTAVSFTPSLYPTWYTLRVVVTNTDSGVHIVGYVDGTKMIDYTETTYVYTSGKIGLKGNYHVHYDNVLVLETDPIKTFTYGEGDDNVRIYAHEGAYTLFSDNFESYDAGTDGSPTWTVTSGTWIIEEENGNKVYSGSNPTGPGGFAISSLTLGTGPMIIETDFVEQGDSPWQNGLILFDYNGPTDFKAAGAAVGADEWRIQHYDGSWHIDAKLPETIDTLTPYHLKVVIEDNKVTLYANDVKKLDYAFSSIGTGKIGLFSVNAHAHFDNYSAKVGYYIANLHTKELGMLEGEYAITVWYQGQYPIKDTYLFDLVDTVQGKGRGKGKA